MPHPKAPPRDHPAQGRASEGKHPAKAPKRETDSALREALLLRKLPVEGFEASNGSAISPAYFHNPEALRTITDVWNAIDPALREMIRREADTIDLSRSK